MSSPVGVEYVVGLGANLGSRRAALRAARLLLSRQPELTLTATSAMYESAAVGPAQPTYLNAAVRLATDLPPEVLLDRLQDVERQLGRVRDERWGPRTLDLDVLWSARPMASGRLTVPHRELERRWFALAPLLDVLPELGPIYAPVLSRLGGAQAPGAPFEDRGAEATHIDTGEQLRSRSTSRAEAMAELLGSLGRRLGGAGAGGALQTRTLSLRGADLLAQAAQAVVEAAAGGFGVVEATVWDIGADQLRLTLVGADATPVHADRGQAQERREADGHVALLVIRRKISDS